MGVGQEGPLHDSQADRHQQVSDAHGIQASHRQLGKRGRGASGWRSRRGCGHDSTLRSSAPEDMLTASNAVHLRIDRAKEAINGLSGAPFLQPGLVAFLARSVIRSSDAEALPPAFVLTRPSTHGPRRMRLKPGLYTHTRGLDDVVDTDWRC